MKGRENCILMEEDKKIALLIDSDNVSSKYLNGIFD